MIYECEILVLNLVQKWCKGTPSKQELSSTRMNEELRQMLLAGTYICSTEVDVLGSLHEWD
ncbi:hypothetical protein POUND7_011329, partial [Theobroma cacao]